MQTRKAIVLGDSFNNTLGLLRSLGEAGHEVSLILVGKEDRLFVFKCRWVKWLHRIASLDEALPLLRSLACPQAKLYCSNDAAAQWVDCHEEDLSHLFLTPMRGRRLNDLFLKERQCQLAMRHGIDVPSSLLYHRGDPLPENLSFPLLMKPADSICGEKSDIHICHNINHLHAAIASPSSCQHFLLQTYIDKDYELNLIGFSTPTEVFIPGAVKKLRHYPTPCGPCSYGYYESVEHLHIDIAPICRMMAEIGYCGPFSVEMLHRQGKNYFLEINFRHDGLAYCATAAGCNFFKDKPLPLPKNIYMMDLGLDFNHVKEKKISILHWLRDLLHTRCQLNFNSRDPMPTIHYYFHKHFKHTSETTSL